MVETLCDPDYINQTIVMYLQRRDSAQDEQARAYAYAATYEDFIKIINDCQSLSMLRQIRLPSSRSSFLFYFYAIVFL